MSLKQLLRASILLLVAQLLSLTSVVAQPGLSPGPGWHYLMATGPDHYGTLRVVNDTLVLTVNRPNDSIPNYHVILYSADHGVTWDSMPPIPQVYDWEWPPGTEGLHPIQLLRNEHDTSFRFVQTFDMGRSWVELGRFPNAMARYFFSGSFRGGGSYFRNPADRQQVWVGFDFVAGRGTIEGLCVRSKDNCQTWEALQFPLPKEGVGAVYHLLFDRTDPRIWYVAVAPYSESNLAAAYYQTTDDGQTFTQVNHWANDAGIAYAGELRSLSHGQDDRYGGKVDEYTGVIQGHGPYFGFNSYSPFDAPDVQPKFVNLFEMLLPRDTSLYQTSVSPQYLRSARNYKFASVEYQLPYESPLKRYHVVVAITPDDAQSYRIILDVSNRFVSDVVDQVTGRYYVAIPRDSTVLHMSFPPSDSFDYWYTDDFRSLLGVGERTAGHSEEFGVTVAPNVISATATIDFSLSNPSWVQVSVIDVVGRKYATVFEGMTPGASGTLQFKPGELGLRPGLYFLRLATADTSFLAKFILK